MPSKRVAWSILLQKVTSRTLGYIMAGVMLLGVVELEITAHSIIGKMDDLRSGRFDNSMWIVSQVEVDFQRFLLAVHDAISVEPPATRQDAIAEVERTFDIYFSRISIVSARASNLAQLGAPSAGPMREMTTIERHLHSLVPLIDNSAGQDAAYFRALLEKASPILPELRQNTMSSLQYIVQSDALVFSNRASILQWLLVITQGMAFGLFAVAGLVSRLSWQLDRRTADYARIGSNLNKAIETSLDAIVITDSNGKISTYNTAAQSMFGFTLAEVKGILIEDLLNSGPKTPGRRRLDGRQIAAKLARSANRGRIRLKLQKSDGTDFMVEAAIASDVDSEGQPIFLGFLRDISKLVKAHDNERAARFEAERSAAASARFLAVMSHEMRTPLHGIIAALDLLDGAPTPKEIALLRNIARDSAGAALEQIEEVLELALHDAMDESEVIMTFFPFEVSRIIVEQWQSLAAASHTSLTLVYDPAMSEPMLGNRRAFRSAVGNLVGNAIKFTKNGTITLRLYPTPDVPHHMRVEVTDTGIGIEPQHLTRIFNDFETVSGPSLAKFSASGLGLGIVRRAVGLMGGTLQLESTFGKGSRFWFDIPQSSALLARADKQPALPHVPLDPALTVLVVDDNAINRLLLAQMLERLGHTVELADDGVVAVEAAAHKRYDMILMDINMPGMNGVEATRMIRAGGASSDVPIMGVTANALPQDLALFVMAGLNCTMIKPITSAALALQMRQLTGPQAATPSPVAQPDVPPLMAVENFRDLRDVMDPAGFAAILAAALDDVGAALSDARGAPPGTALASQIHGAAGPAALIGANRLHLVLCDLENATRRNQTAAMESLLADAVSAWQDTADWIKAALL